LFKKLIMQLLIWRVKYLPDRIFLIIVSIVIGILSGLTAVLLKTSVHFMQNILHSSFEDYYNTYFFLIYPVIGLMLSTLFIHYFRKGKLQRGVGNVLLEITRNKGIVARHKLFSQLISSFFTLGFGGSAGLEAPISVTGAAIGSQTSIAFRLKERERKLLLGCGAAGGIAAIFNSPIAGVLFAIEILLIEMTVPAFIPLLISSASATVVSKLLYEGQPFKLITEEWDISSLPYYILLGIICSFLSVYIIKAFAAIQKFFVKKFTNPFLKALYGGAAVGLMIFILPPLFGEGYFIVEALLDGNYLRMLDGSIFWQFKDEIWFILIFAFAAMMLKVVATAITVNSGGNGGMFGSSLFIGAILGFIYSRLINLSGFQIVAEPNFIVVAMAGILAGVIQAPLTAIFLIAEITGGYALFIPLMVVVALAYFITVYFEPNSVYTKEITERGEFVKYDRDRMVLENFVVSRIIETDFEILNEKDTLGDLVSAISRTTRNIFPVVDDENNLKGIVLLDDVREVMFNRTMYNLIIIKDIIRTPPAIVEVKERMYEIIRKFDEQNTWNLPVVKEGKYLGFISKANILNHYRDLLKRLSRGYG
jgi:chloride channel protein, CIC family